jgi:predicted ATPase/DNA-binding winged helix-turn-helix (wHTH) protein
MMDTTPSQTAARQADAAILVFGPFALHRASQRLLKGDEPVRIGSRAFGLLVDLVESAGQLRSREQLEARVWPRSVVEETSLRVHMSALRRALGDGRDGARYIANVPGRGYSFIATVTRLAEAGAPSPTGERTMRHPRLIGRAQDVQLLQARCARTRLLSIVGPGGIGKSALALALAEQLAPQFVDGVLYADLAGVGVGSACVIDTVAAAAGVSLPPGAPTAALGTALSGRRQLLVLDNCDRVVDAAAALAIALRQHVPGIHMLVTTREPLDVEGEQVHWLDSLATPADALADPAAAAAFAGVALFVERARANHAGFVLDHTNVADVCRLCRNLDGIPLAIELAAARVEALGVAGMAAELDGLLGLLTRARRTALPRHRTMAATLAWSFELLADDERAVLCRSAVFQGDFSIGAARGVCACERIDADAVARCIESLAVKSLLARRMVGGKSLYRQLLLTKTFVLGKLDDAEKARLARCHAHHVATLLAGSAAAVAEQMPPPWLEAHGRSFDDCRAALDWAFGGQGEHALGIGMTPRLIQTLRFLGMPDDSRRRLMLTLDERGAPRLASEAAISVYTALVVLGAYSHHETDLLRDVLARLHGLLRVVDSPVLRFEALMAMGAAAYGLGESGLLLEIVREVRLLAEPNGDAAIALMADRLESSARHFRGEHGLAQALCERVLRSTVPPSSCDVSSPTPSPVGARWNLARIAWILGRPELAAQIAHEALVYAEKQHVLAQCQTLVIVAVPVALWRGDDALAARLIARLQVLADGSHSPYWQGWARAYRAAAGRRGAHGGGARAPDRPAALAPIAGDMLATLDAGMVDPSTLARADGGAIGWCAAEVWRAQGELLLREDARHHDQAEALFLRALALARRQQALGWELRAARSLLRCWRGGPRADEGRLLLAQTLGRFGEGLDSADCRAAAADLADTMDGQA